MELRSSGMLHRRALGGAFLDDLADGVLAPLLEGVKLDATLSLELRGEYINVYYRGGSLLRVSASSPAGRYDVFFDGKYFRSEDVVDYPRAVGAAQDVRHLFEVTPFLKRAMDRFFAKRRNEEGEVQQRIVYDNNASSIALGTDYYACDIEYMSSYGKFDIVAVHWPSSHERKRSRNRRLVFIEVKHGDGALSEASGIVAHVRDVNAFASDAGRLGEIKSDMVRVFNQKRSMGLLECNKDLESFGAEKPLFVLMLANHDPDSIKLRRELSKLPPSPHVELRLGTASFLGCGLYDQGIHTLDQSKARFGDYICSR